MTFSSILAACPLAALVLCGLLFPGSPVSAQSLGDLVRETPQDTTAISGPPGPSPAPWKIVVGEVVVGSALAAAAGYGVGLLAETACSDCDASQPGGDTAGLLIGVPLGATVGVWLIGRMAPPPGKLGDTLLGALVGTAIFAGYAEILSESSNAVRWLGVIFPGALAAMGWNRSRASLVVETASAGGPGIAAELVVFRLEF